MSEIQDQRRTVSEGALLSPSQAAELLGFRGALEWLQREGLITRIGVGGREVRRVVWRQVLERLEGKAAPPTGRARRRTEYRVDGE